MNVDAQSWLDYLNMGIWFIISQGPRGERPCEERMIETLPSSGNDRKGREL